MKTEKGLPLSIVATVYNDAGITPVLVDEIVKAVQPLKIDFEIILVNDCSSDGSEEVIRGLCAKFPFVKGISLARNFGQQIAVCAGVVRTQGDYVVVMDGDLQNPPSAIPRLYEKIQAGHDLVYAVSHVRNNAADDFSSRFFWFILHDICKVDIVPNQLMLKIMNRRVAAAFKDYPEISRTVEGIVGDIATNYAVIEVENQKRRMGSSHYNFLKRVNLMIEMIISLTSAPLNFMIYFGTLMSFLTMVGSVYYVVDYLRGDILPGFTSILLSIFFFGSLILLMLGFIGKYLANIYGEVRRRPLFHVSKTFNL
ncbi:MAG: glycosyltransferase family 2 protein [Deltaproteobacteria bacterium]|nr:glycosyltransferase family 2 protein [Deltaproteobacteria bacterium]